MKQRGALFIFTKDFEISALANVLLAVTRASFLVSYRWWVGRHNFADCRLICLSGYTGIFCYWNANPTSEVKHLLF